MHAAPFAPPTWFPLRWQLSDTPKPWPEALTGRTPLPWWSAGWYDGELQSLLTALRQAPERNQLRGPLQPLLKVLHSLAGAPADQTLWLVPIPGWRQQPNPVPALLASALVQQAPGHSRWQLGDQLLERNCRIAPQHRLGRRQRWSNQWLSFRAQLAPDPGSAGADEVLLIDDVLTSGATALAAQHALHSAGWRVAGLLCLARTPRRRHSQRHGRGGVSLA